MTGIRHHVPDGMMRDYVSGALGYPFELVVATHVSMCDECRARLGVHEALGGAMLEGARTEEVSPSLRERVLAGLAEPAPPAPPPSAFDIYPEPLARALGGRAPRWRSLGLGVRQCILHQDRAGSARLLFIPPGQAMPEHGHGGLELTLVLQGSFRDDAESFGPGDLEVADDATTHIPVSGPGLPCICLAATDAPLRFKSLIPRLTQRYFRI